MSRNLRTRTPFARIVVYRCRRDAIFRLVWPELDAPLVHPCPTCGGTALRLIGTRPDVVSA